MIVFYSSAAINTLLKAPQDKTMKQWKSVEFILRNHPSHPSPGAVHTWNPKYLSKFWQERASVSPMKLSFSVTNGCSGCFEALSKYYDVLLPWHVICLSIHFLHSSSNLQCTENPLDLSNRERPTNISIYSNLIDKLLSQWTWDYFTSFAALSMNSNQSN